VGAASVQLWVQQQHVQQQVCTPFIPRHHRLPSPFLNVFTVHIYFTELSSGVDALADLVTTSELVCTADISACTNVECSFYRLLYSACLSTCSACLPACLALTVAPQLTHLDVSNNSITAEGLSLVVDALIDTGSQCITSLNLADNDVGGKVPQLLTEGRVAYQTKLSTCKLTHGVTLLPVYVLAGCCHSIMNPGSGSWLLAPTLQKGAAACADLVAANPAIFSLDLVPGSQELE
jgi:hypothetical protein